LLRIARQGTGPRPRRVADFLLAWHNAEENGGWDPVDLWSVDTTIADDMLTVLRLVRESHRYPDALGFNEEIAAVWRLLRGGRHQKRIQEGTKFRQTQISPILKELRLAGYISEIAVRGTEALNILGAKKTYELDVAVSITCDSPPLKLGLRRRSVNPNSF
jgi:hypothetical protein